MSTKKDFSDFMTVVAETTGIEAMKPDESGLVSVRIDERYNLNLQFIEASSKILCFVEIGNVPENAPAQIYRELMAAGLFGQETGGGNFALEPHDNAIVYQYMFDFDPVEMDSDTLTSTLEKILSLADLWSERLQKIVSATSSATVSTPDNSAFVRV